MKRSFTRRALRALGWLLAVLLLVCVVAGVGGYFYLRRSLAQTAGTVKAAGLRAALEVVRDADGVPHVFAASRADAYFGLGFVHAQDRLWQMELQRRAGRGRLSEIFGPRAIGGDRFLRTLGLYTAAESAWATLPPDAKETVNAYVAGVNAFLEGGTALPPEFTILGAKPERWSGPDVLAVVKMVALNLDSVHYSTELLREDLVRKVGAERAAQLLPAYPAGAAFIAGSGPDAEAHARLAALSEEAQSLFGLGGLNRGYLGSNSWVVDGSKSTTGKPFLANDPHLRSSAPSTWYLAHLSAGDLDVIGATIPGLPLVAIGRNRHIAWGITHLVADAQDLFAEQLDASGGAAIFQGRPEPLRLVEETIKVKGQPDVRHTVRLTRHGPLISDVLNQNEAAQAPPGQAPTQLPPMALRWSALEPTDNTVSAFLRMNAARNWGEFSQALAEHCAPAFNFVYADVEGNIGYRAAGLVPLRGEVGAAGQGAGESAAGGTPPGATAGAREWTGWIPFEELPQAFNPPRHFIVTANNRPAGPDYRHDLGQQWAQPYRADRITQMLGAKERLSPEDHAALQGDTVSLQARELLPLLRGLVTPRTPERQRALRLLEAWDGDARGDSAAAALYEAWLQRLPRAIAGDELGEAFAGRYEERPEAARFLADTLADPASPWCDDTRTPQPEGCAEAAGRALDEALAELSNTLGGEMERWRWDSLHLAVFAHQPFNNVKALRPFFSRTVGNGGDRSTVNVGAFVAGRSFEQYVAPSYRQLIDLSNPDGGRFTLAPGQSGHFLSSHYDDLLADWRALRYRPLRFERATVERGEVERLRLEP